MEPGGAVGAGLLVTASCPTDPRASSNKDAAAWLFFLSCIFGKRAETGSLAGPASAGCCPLPTAGKKPLATLGVASRAASPRGAGAHGSSVGGGSPRAPTGARGFGNSLVKAAPPPTCCLPPGSAGWPSFPKEGVSGQSRHGAPAFGAPLSAHQRVLAVSCGGWGGRHQRAGSSGMPLCQEQSQRAS